MKWLVIAKRERAERAGYYPGWEVLLGHPPRGPLIVTADTPEQALEHFAEREDVALDGLGVVQV